MVFFLSPPPSLWVEPSCLPACISHKCPTLVNCFPLCHSPSLFSSEILLYEWNIANCIINLKKSILAIGGLSCWQKQYLYCCCSGVTSCPTLWPQGLQASLSFTIPWSLLKLMSNESVKPSNNLILHHPLLLLSSVFPSIRVFFSMSWLFTSGGQSIGDSSSASVLSKNIQGWFPLGLTGLIFAVQETVTRPPVPQFESINSSALSLKPDNTFKCLLIETLYPSVL